MSTPDDLPVSLLDLRRRIVSLPLSIRTEVEIALTQVERDFIRRRKALSVVADCLEELRLDIQYLKFDLEATRRERDKALGL